MGNWFRVTDPLSPLFGCDVKLSGRKVWNVAWADGVRFAEVVALRRVDIFVGDRPFQLIAPEGDSLGILIDEAHLNVSSLQDEIFELDTSRPYGECLDEWEVTRADGLTLHVAAFELVIQAALLSKGKLLKSATFKSHRHPDIIREMFEDGHDVDSILDQMVAAEGWDGEEG